MPELINLYGDHSAHFVAEAFSESDLWKRFERRPDGLLEISLVVNGVEVPFVAAIRRVYELMRQNLDQSARRLLVDQADEALLRLVAKLDQFRVDFVDEVATELRNCLKVSAD